MYIQAWKKYLPVIAILIKRSAESTQTLAMDSADFVKSSGGKKLKLGFASMTLNKGRVPAGSAQPEVAKQLVTLLNETESLRSVLPTRNLLLSMSNDCLLTISNADTVAAE